MQPSISKLSAPMRAVLEESALRRCIFVVETEYPFRETLKHELEFLGPSVSLLDTMAASDLDRLVWTDLADHVRKQLAAGTGCILDLEPLLTIVGEAGRADVLRQLSVFERPRRPCCLALHSPLGFEAACRFFPSSRVISYPASTSQKESYV